MAFSQSAIKAGNAYFELVGIDKTAAMFKSVEQRLTNLGRSVTIAGGMIAAAGAGIVAPLIAATNQFASIGDEVNKMAARTGMSTETLSALGFAAEQSGAKLADVEKGMKRLSAGLFQQSEETRRALTEIGLGFDDLAGKSPEQAFAMVADGLAGVTDEMQRNAAAQALLGRSGTQLIPMFGQVNELMAEAKRLGLVITPEQAEAAAEYTDAMNRVSRTVKAVVFQIGSALAPALSAALNLVVPFIAETADWIKENKGLVISIGLAGAALLALGGTLTGLGLSITVIGIAIGGLGTALAAVGGVVSFLLSQLVLVPAAAIAALAALAAFAGAFDGMGAKIQSIGGVFSKMFGGIIDALKSGELGLASELAWAGFELAALKAIKTVTEAYAAMADLIPGMGEAMFGDMIAGLDKMVLYTNAKMEGLLADIADAGAKAADAAGDDPAGLINRGNTLRAADFKNNYEARGSFSGIGAARVAGGRDRTQKEIAENTKITAELLRKLTRKFGGGAFT